VAASVPPGKEGLGVNFGVAINAVAYFNVAIDVVAAYTAFVVCRWGWIGCDQLIYYGNQFRPDQPWDGGETFAF
jgi:hypothetical protein